MQHKISMLRRRRISESLEESLRINQPNADTTLIKAWQLCHGSKLFGAISVFIGLSSLISCLTLTEQVDDLYGSLYFCAFFFQLGDSMVFWGRRRSAIRDVTKLMIKAARDIEGISSHQHLAKMAGATVRYRFLSIFLNFDRWFNIVIHMMYPFVNKKLYAPMPFLPENKVVFLLACCFQVLCMSMGLVASLSMILSLVNTTLFLSSLFSVLSEKFQKPSLGDDIHSLISIHQDLLNSGAALRGIFSHSWGVMISMMLSVLVCGTYVTISTRGEAPMIIFVVFALQSMAYLVCLLGEGLSISSESVAFSVYKGLWNSRQLDGRKDLCLVMLRSQRPCYLTAGVFGKVDIRLYQNYLKNWYKFLQALLNLERG